MLYFIPIPQIVCVCVEMDSIINNVEGIVNITPIGDAPTYVNGNLITEPTILHHVSTIFPVSLPSPVSPPPPNPQGLTPFLNKLMLLLLWPICKGCVCVCGGVHNSARFSIELNQQLISSTQSASTVFTC